MSIQSGGPAARHPSAPLDPSRTLRQGSDTTVQADGSVGECQHPFAPRAQPPRRAPPDTTGANLPGWASFRHGRPSRGKEHR